MSLKRALLDAAIADDPDPDAFEGWLLDRCLRGPDETAARALRAMARDILAEWRLARRRPRFPGLTGGGRAVRGPRRAYKPRSERPGWSSGRRPRGQRYLRSLSWIGRSLMLATRRPMRPFPSNSQFSFPYERNQRPLSSRHS